MKNYSFFELCWVAWFSVIASPKSLIKAWREDRRRTFEVFISRWATIIMVYRLIYTPYFVLHARFQNSWKKWQKMHVQFQKACKKDKNEKKESTLVWNFFALISHVPIFCIFNLKIHAKKAKMQKKGKQFCQIREI